MPVKKTAKKSAAKPRKTICNTAGKALKLISSSNAGRVLRCSCQPKSKCKR